MDSDVFNSSAGSFGEPEVVYEAPDAGELEQKTVVFDESFTIRQIFDYEKQGVKIIYPFDPFSDLENVMRMERSRSKNATGNGNNIPLVDYDA